MYVMMFVWCKAEYFASLLQSSVSHDPSEIIMISDLLLMKHLWLLSVLKTVLLNILVETEQRYHLNVLGS